MTTTPPQQSHKRTAGSLALHFLRWLEPFHSAPCAAPPAVAHLILVRPMTRSLYIIAGAILLVASAATAADAPSFAAAAANSAEKFKTDQGGQYGIAFMKSAGRALVPAAQTCKGSNAPVGSYHDIVFVVSASGRIEHIIHGRRSAYGDCVTSHLRMPTFVAKPPRGSWPIHIRFLHGRQGRDEQPPFMVVSDDAG